LSVTVFGSITTFKDLFAYIMDLSKHQSFTLIIDEFQEFFNINSSIYSDMQHIWDINKHLSHINLILCGSIYSLMHKIFENSKEPLFGRAASRIQLLPFSIDALKNILNDYYPKHTNEDLLAMHALSDRVAKYVELFMQEKALSFEAMIKEIFLENSLFLDEGKNILIDEFGKDYGSYFSILTLIASSKTSRSEIESTLRMQVGSFLDRLENNFSLISKVRPILANPLSRNVRYRIPDNFLNFWFRFIYKYRSAIEMRNFKYVKDIIKRDYTAYSGTILERYFTKKIANECNLSVIGSYWEVRNKNEIDIVAINEYEKRVLFAEIKRQKKNIDIALLKSKASRLVQKLTGYKINFQSFSMEDM
jgi:AAA+ ATPase superfamily predicted ATPase